MKVRQRLFYIILFPVMLLLIVLIVLQVGIGFRKDARKSTYEILQKITEQYSAAVSDSLSEKYSVLNGLAQAVVQDGTYLHKDSLYQMVLPIVKTNVFATIGFADNDGTVYTSVGTNQLESASFDSQQTIVNREYFRTAMKGETAIERVAESKLSGQPRTVLAVPVFLQDDVTDPAGTTVVGVVFGSFTDEAFLKLFQPISYADEASVVITDETGTVILASANSGVKTADNILDILQQSSLTDMTLTQVTGAIESAQPFSCALKTPDQIERYMRMLPFPVNNWLLFSAVPNSAVSQSSKIFTKSAATLFIELLLIAAAALAAVMSYDKKQQKTLAAEKELLRQSEERYRFVSDFSGDVIFEGNYNTGQVSYSPQFFKVFGYDLGQPNMNELNAFERYIYAEDLDSFQKVFGLFLKGAPFSELDFRMLRQGQYSWVRVDCKNMMDENGKPLRFLGKLSIVDKEHDQINMLVEKAERDPLTGLYNREGTSARITPYLLNSRPHTLHALMLFDIDKFKHINDEYGHQEGDAVLKEFARILSASVRVTDVVARIGGDEFVVFMPFAESIDSITECAQRILKKLADSKSRQGNPAFTSSFGIAQWPKDGQDFDALYKAADQALYKVKSEGGNAFLVYQEIK